MPVFRFEQRIPLLSGRRGERVLTESASVDLRTEDFGKAIIASIADDAVSSTLYVRLQSWDEDVTRDSDLDDPARHADFRSLLGKRVRITIETLDDSTGDA